MRREEKRREEKRREEKTYRDSCLWVALALSLVLGVQPAAAQTTGIQRTWLQLDETSQLGDLLFGPGVAEVVTASAGTTTAGGRVSWIRYFEKDDQLGMHHVYYRQQYQHPQLGRALKVLGTGVALHYGPDGVLRRANLAQVTDVPRLPNVALTTPQQVFAAAQMGLGSWPGFRVGSTSQWPAGALANFLDGAELALTVPRGGGDFRLQWRISTLDADLSPYTALVDAATGALLGVSAANPSDCPPPPVGCAHCSPGPPPPEPSYCGLAAPVSVPAKAKPENPDLWPWCGTAGIGCGADGYRNVNANAFTHQYEQETSCGTTCTHEGVRAAQPAYPGNPGIPQIEVYHGVPGAYYARHCGCPSEGDYMRVGLKVVAQGQPTYDASAYPTPPSIKGPCVVDWNYRTYAGDAMYYTLQTMEVFRDEFGRCGFDGDCGPARVTVAACGGTTGAQFMYQGHQYATLDGVAIYRPAAGYRSMSSALDIVAHEWGHGVSKYSPADFFGTCDAQWESYPEPCEMSEGFADVVGHVVERLKQPLPDDGSWLPEHWDWTAGEDWAGGYADRVRRADLFDPVPCDPGNLDDYHYSVHADDPGCEPDFDQNQIPEHSHGNRLSVVLKLMTDGGFNPASGQIPCTNCDLEVTPLDPDPDTAFHMAAEILFRVLDTEADSTTLDWDDLPVLARNAVQDIYWWDHAACVAAQVSAIDAFRAVGYPQAGAPPCVACNPFQQEPCCPPDYPCLGEPE